MTSTFSQVAEDITAANDTTATTATNTLKDLSAISVDELLNKLIDGAIDFAISLSIALIVFFVGKFIINKIHRFK